jgi:23S rRNA-/tRNA-specific pseudouridylate synthase
MHWSLEERYSNSVSLLRINLRTGFLHQIRASFAHYGIFILGDEVYGAPESIDLSKKLSVSRMLLHCSEFEWKGMKAVAPFTEEFETFRMKMK